MTFTNIGKEDYREIRLHPKIYSELEKFCQDSNFKTWSSAIEHFLLQIKQLKRDNVKLKMQINLLNKKWVSDVCYELIRKEYVPIGKIKDRIKFWKQEKPENLKISPEKITIETEKMLEFFSKLIVEELQFLVGSEKEESLVDRLDEELKELIERGKKR